MVWYLPSFYIHYSNIKTYLFSSSITMVSTQVLTGLRIVERKLSIVILPVHLVQRRWFLVSVSEDAPSTTQIAAPLLMYWKKSSQITLAMVEHFFGQMQTIPVDFGVALCMIGCQQISVLLLSLKLWVLHKRKDSKSMKCKQSVNMLFKKLYSIRLLINASTKTWWPSLDSRDD